MKILILFIVLSLISTPAFALTNGQRLILKAYHNQIADDRDAMDAYEETDRQGRIVIILAWIADDLRPQLLQKRDKAQRKLDVVDQAVTDWGG